jgi:hypothetical protein
VWIVAAAALSCSRDPTIEERAVVVYSPRACPVEQRDAYSVIYAGGDFEPSVTRPPTASVFLREVGRPLETLPKETRSVVVDISQGDATWRGFTEVPRQGPINVLVWPGGRSCQLSRNVERRTDMTLGVVGRELIVAGGRSFDGLQVPHTYVGDLTTGRIEQLAIGLKTRRAHPSITSFRTASDGDGPSAALVAGGEDPETNGALASAEVYVPNPGGVGDFDGSQIELAEPRTRHGAVVLASGETLLVGGRAPAGPLRTMEIVDPKARRARTAGVALLRVPRERPTVVRLSSGEILVAGGLDANDEPIPTLEWFSSDASRATRRPVDLVTGRERAIVPLDAGGALAVILPEPGSTPDFKTVWMISADGTLEPAVSLDPTTLDTVRMFAGADNAPVLWTGRRWHRWAPWLGAFQPLVDAPDNGPPLDAFANGDSGLALWLEDGGEAGMNVTGFRFATRTRFGAVAKPLLVSGPEQLAPDRLAGQRSSSIQFESERGLVLGPGASAFVTDVTFADFELAIDVTAAAPTVVLRPEVGTELEIGGAGCAFAQVAHERLALIRRGPRVDVKIDAAPYRTCAAEIDRRVSIGLRGAQDAPFSAARNLVIVRR